MLTPAQERTRWRPLCLGGWWGLERWTRLCVRPRPLKPCRHGQNGLPRWSKAVVVHYVICLLEGCCSVQALEYLYTKASNHMAYFNVAVFCFCCLYIAVMSSSHFTSLFLFFVFYTLMNNQHLYCYYGHYVLSNNVLRRFCG